MQTGLKEFDSHLDDSKPESYRLELIMGPMFSGKSTELIRRLTIRSLYRKVVGVNSKKDIRYGLNGIVTHTKASMPCIKIDNLSELLTNSEYLSAQVVGIDEGNFYPDISTFIVDQLEKTNKTFIISGLDGDKHKKFFGTLHELIPHAEKKDFLRALCKRCGNGTEASFTVALQKFEGQEKVGGGDVYEAVCRHHYNRIRLEVSTNATDTKADHSVSFPTSVQIEIYGRPLIPDSNATHYMTDATETKHLGLGNDFNVMVDDKNQIWLSNREGFGLLKSEIGWMPSVKKLTCGMYHTAFIDGAGAVWTFDRGDKGQLGHGNFEDIAVPTRLEEIQAVTIACGYEHTACVDAKGNVWTFGLGTDNQLGHGRAENVNKPTMAKIPDGTPVRQVACGSWHTLALDKNDILWYTGDIANTNIALPAIKSSPVFASCAFGIDKIACGSFNTVYVTTDGRLVVYSTDFEDGFKDFSSQYGKIKQVECGMYHIAILNRDGQVCTMGGGGNGQLGYKTPDDKPTTEFKMVEGIGPASKIVCGQARTAIFH